MILAISESFIQELKARTDIADIISSYVHLKKSGKGLVGLCPFHTEKTPSFNVQPENGFFYCFGCHVGGDVITFIKRAENLDYIDALKFLADRAGMEIPQENHDNGTSELRRRIYEANRETARFYHKQLYSPLGKNALGYLRKRGLTEKTIIHFGLGYSPPERFALVNYLKSKGFTNYEIISANLANETRNGYAIDRFSDRVMFPIIDLRGNVIAFGGRIMSDIKPKYLNTSDTLAFDKGRNLYSLQFAKNKANGQLILVEGYMDVIALHQAGFENTVATLGTSLTTEQAAIIKRYCDEVVICYDSDTAGQNATSRAINIFRPTGIKIKVLTVPNGKDPDEFIKSYGEQGAARFRVLLEESGNDIRYKLNKLRAEYDTENTEQRIEFLKKAAMIIAELDDGIEKGVYIAKLAEEFEIEKSKIQQDVSVYERKKFNNKKKKQQREVQVQLSAMNNRINSEKSSNLRAANAEEALIALIINNPDTAEKICQKVESKIFVTGFNRKVYEVLKKRTAEKRDISLTDISGEFSNDEVSSITEMLVSHPRENDPFLSANEYIRILKEEGEKLTPQQIKETDLRTLNEMLKKQKELKK